MAKKSKSGIWKVDIRPEGSTGKRIRKEFNTFSEANRFESFILGKAAEGNPWNPSKNDNRKFSELIQVWYDNHGQYLADGKRTQANLINICSAMGDPVASKMEPGDFLKYRKSKKGINGKKINPKTLNNHLGYVNAVFNNLRKTREIDYENPFTYVDKIRIHERELSWLTQDQIKELFETIDYFSKNPGVALITEICLSTGCRWGEAEALTVTRVKNGAITFTNTKSKKSRTIPIDKKLENKIIAHDKSRAGALFSGKPLLSFDKALKKCSFKLPAGQSSHVLRHSFASHFIMNGGDIMGLQKILGHSTILMTMKYAHLAPDHLSLAKTLNPMKKLAI